jgi:hypothetical protein
MNQTYLNYIAGACLLGLWTGLVVSGHTDQSLIEAIKYALGSLGVFHGITNFQATQSPTATSPKSGALPTIPPANPK